MGHLLSICCHCARSKAISSRRGKGGRRLLRRRAPRNDSRAGGAPAMTEFRYDHVHLRSPDPDATAAWYAKMFGAEVVHSVMSNGIERTDMRLAGVNHFIAKVPDSAELAEKPENGFVGLDHIGLRVNDIDAVCAELKAKGAEFTIEPKTIRPGVRIAFVRGPQNVLIELLDRDVI